MFREITIGQYYAADSWIHRLDPRTKLAGTMLFIISLFFAKGVFCYLLAVLFLAAAVRTSTVPFSYMLRGLKGILILLLFSVGFNLFLTAGTPLIRIGKVQITVEGLKMAIYMTVRLVLLITGASLMTLTTTPNDLTDGLEKGLGFLKKIHIPVHEMAMIMSIALRFIPILVEETDKIMKAQMARGADFESGKLIQKIKNMVPLLVPLFISAFRRASDLALAMEARCYHGGEGRTKMKPLHYTKADHQAYGMLFGMLAIMLILRYTVPWLA